jgi:putative ABC transport system permease protein
MFALVVFSLVVMSALNYNFTQLFLGEDADAGFNVSVEGNEANPIPDLRAALTATGSEVADDIEGVARLTEMTPDAHQPGVVPEADEGDGFQPMRVQSVDDEFLDLASLSFQLRATGFATDADVTEALRTDPNVAVIDVNVLALPPGAFVFGEPGVADPFRLEQSSIDLREGPWEPIPVTLRDPETGEEAEVSVIAVVESQVTGLLPALFGSTFMHDSAVEAALGQGDAFSYLVTTTDKTTDGEVAVANGIESSLLESGVQAQSIQRLMEDSTAQASGFQLLFEAFMGLGLIVGIAALGVIAFRTVVERRQQIGMLRAIGYSRRLVAVSFFMESSFIAILGTAMGFFLGLALSYNLLTSPDFTDGSTIDFQVPWARLALIGGIAYIASALMTIIPARAASRVAVAEALRYE